MTATTEALKMARDALAPCPHCALLHPLKLTTAQELAEEGEDDPEPWMQSDSFAVICDASRPNGPGGCGASGGFFPSEAEAIAAWNRRAAIDALPSAPAWPCYCDERGIGKPGVTCGDCPRDYGHTPASAPSGEPLRRGSTGVCSRKNCECERARLGNQCIWLRPTDAELQRRTGEPHIDGWPLYSGLPPPQAVHTAAAPQAQAVRAPLTDAQLDAMRQSAAGLNFVTLREFRVIARAVEAALSAQQGE